MYGSTLSEAPTCWNQRRTHTRQQTLLRTFLPCPCLRSQCEHGNGQASPPQSQRQMSFQKKQKTRPPPQMACRPGESAGEKVGPPQACKVPVATRTRKELNASRSLMLLNLASGPMKNSVHHPLSLPPLLFHPLSPAPHPSPPGRLFPFTFLPHLSLIAHCLLSNPCVTGNLFRSPSSSWSQANPRSVPPLPPLADPELFIQFHDAIRNPLNKPNEKYDNFRLRMTSPFSVLAKRGDGILNIKCLDIIYEYFGADNPRLVNMIHDHLVSNEVWKELAVAYKLHLYIGVARTRYDDKWWADVWEAYWGALFIERQFWNDNGEDLTGVLRRLVYIQCKAAYEHLVNFPFYCLSPCPLIVGPFFKDPDLDIERISNPPYLHTSKGLENTILGYRVQIKETGVFACAQDEELAKTKLYFSSRTPWGNSLPPTAPNPQLTFSRFLSSHH